MKKFVLIYSVAVLSAGIVYAFSNSLDYPVIDKVNTNNNFSNPSGSQYIQRANSAYNPKENTGFQQRSGEYSNPNVNDTRYNSNCQFGTCTPGGLNPNNR